MKSHRILRALVDLSAVSYWMADNVATPKRFLPNFYAISVAQAFLCSKFSNIWTKTKSEESPIFFNFALFSHALLVAFFPVSGPALVLPRIKLFVFSSNSISVLPYYVFWAWQLYICQWTHIEGVYDMKYALRSHSGIIYAYYNYPIWTTIASLPHVNIVKGRSLITPLGIQKQKGGVMPTAKKSQAKLNSIPGMGP